MFSMDLPRCAPEEVGISSKQVETCIRALSHSRTTMNGFMAARHGKVFAEGWWAPYRSDMPHSNHSFGKSYTATAIGIAIGEGLVSLDDKMVDIFKDYIKEKNISLPENMDKITLQHVLTMTNGMAYMPAFAGDWIYNYFTTPVVHEPGSYFQYNSTGSCMLGAIILQKSGLDLKEYLTDRLFNKIGIDPNNFQWRKFPNGIDAEPGTFATTEANLRLGMLYLQEGKWNGEQVVPSEYIKDAMSIHIPTTHAPEPKDGLCGYGYQLWACSIPGAYRFDGGQGQYAIIWPEKDLVVAIHEAGVMPIGPQTTLDTVYEYLFPFLQDDILPKNDSDYNELLNVCASLKVPDDLACEEPKDVSFSGKYTISDGHFDPWLAVAPPGVDDFFYLFRTQEKDIPVTSFMLDIKDSECLLTFNKDQTLTASWDGTLTCHFVDSPFDPLGNYAATAHFTKDGQLVYKIHWLNGWFETTLTFTKAENSLEILTQKLRLNESNNNLEYHAVATKE